uniref:Uncharacterized protein n=1 Tax=Panagrolaimus sp. ES5 TaxID=591445 RepID=A0AC34FTF2_9BILA
MIEPDTFGTFKNLNKLKEKSSPRIGSKMKLEHQECIEYYTWKCVINQNTLDCYMNMRKNEVTEIINFCSNLAYTELGVALDTFEDVEAAVVD